MGILFFQRSAGYKIGLLLVLVGVVCYIIGFSAPYWTVYRASHKSEGGRENIFISGSFHSGADYWGHNGLWDTCSIVHEFSAEMCAAISHLHGYPAWMSAVQGLQSVGLTGLVISALYAGGVNFVWRKPVHNRYLEILLLLSGMFGFSGSTIYAAESFGNDQILTARNNYYDSTDPQQQYKVERNELAWAFAVGLTGSLLAIISAVLIYTQNGYLPRENAPPGVSFSSGGGVVFLPPGYLAGGCSSPPPYTASESSVSGSVPDNAVVCEASRSTSAETSTESHEEERASVEV